MTDLAYEESAAPQSACIDPEQKVQDLLGRFGTGYGTDLGAVQGAAVLTIKNAIVNGLRSSNPETRRKAELALTIILDQGLFAIENVLRQPDHPAARGLAGTLHLEDGAAVIAALRRKAEEDSPLESEYMHPYDVSSRAALVVRTLHDGR